MLQPRNSRIYTRISRTVVNSLISSDRMQYNSACGYFFGPDQRVAEKKTVYTILNIFSHCRREGAEIVLFSS